MTWSLSCCARSLSGDPAGTRSTARQRGFTLVEAVVVLLIVGLVVVIAIPNMARARFRAIMLGQMKQVRQAAMVARIDAIRGGRQTVLGLTTELGRPALYAWRDDNGDEQHQTGETVIGRWTFSERVTVAEDTVSSDNRTLRTLTGSGPNKGVVFLPNGVANSHGTAGVGQGGFVVSDVRGNRFRVTIQGGSGTVTEEMQDPTAAGGWTTRYVNWRY